MLNLNYILMRTKKLLLILIVFATAAPVLAQLYDDPIWAQEEEKPTFKRGESVIYLGGNISGQTSFSRNISSAQIEFNRSISSNLYWGTFFSYQANTETEEIYVPKPGLPTPDVAYMDIVSLYGMFYYRLPVINTRLSLRMGAGIGVGYHSINLSYRNNAIKDKVLPYATASIQWIYRTKKGLEFKFAPLIISPSQFNYSPMGIDKQSKGYMFSYDLFHISIGYVF